MSRKYGNSDNRESVRGDVRVVRWSNTGVCLGCFSFMTVVVVKRLTTVCPFESLRCANYYFWFGSRKACSAVYRRNVGHGLLQCVERRAG